MKTSGIYVHKDNVFCTIYIDILKTIAKNFSWTVSMNNPQTLTRKTAFQKSQKDIASGRINSYKNSDELFKKLF